MCCWRNSTFHALRKSRSVLCAAALFFLVFRCAASDLALDQWILKKWQTADGLPQNSVCAIVQDHSGYLWLGTENGLVRFDGVRFEVFNEDTPPKIPHNFVTSLLVTRDGSVWAGTRTGGLFRYRHDIFDVPVPALAEEKVWALAEAPDGSIWVGGHDRLTQISGTNIVRSFGPPDGLPPGQITALEASDPDVLWVGSAQGSLSRYSGGKLETLPRPGLPYNTAIRGLARDLRNGDLWIGHDGDGLFRIRTNSPGEFQRVDLLRQRDSEHLQALSIGSDGTLWIGTQNDGVMRLKEGVVETFGAADGLTYNDVISIFRDRENSIWAGVLYGGLNQIHEGNIALFTTRHGLPVDHVRCVLEDEPGKFWVAAKGAGLLKLENSRFTPITLGTNRNLDIWALLRSRDGDLWIGTDGAGLGRYSADGRYRSFTTADGLPQDLVTALFEARSGDLWVGSQREGLCVWDPKTLRVKARYQQDFFRTHIRCFAEDENGSLWIGTQNGLVRLHDGVFTPHLLTDYPEASIRAIIPEPGGIFWIATRDDGLLRFDGSDVFRFGPNAGLAHNRIYSLLRTGGEFWLGGNRGIERVSLANLEAVRKGIRSSVNSQLFTERDGLLTTETTADSSPSAIIGKDGRVWFGTRRGLARLSPSELVQNEVVPTVVIKRVSLDSEPVELEQFKNVPAGVSRIRIAYTGLSLRDPANVLFQHKLEPLDKDWVDAARRRDVAYYRLRPGNYSFRVRACNDNGIWNEKGTRLSFTVLPRFYETTWFYLCVGFCGLAGAGGFFRWRVGGIRRQNEKLEALVALRTQEMQALNADLENRVAVRTAQLSTALDDLQSELRERQNVEQALARSEARLRRIVDSGMVGILFWHKSGAITEANNTFLSMVGLSREEFEEKGLQWNDITPPEYLHKDAAALEEIERTGICQPFEKEYIRPDGSRFPVLLGGASLSNDGDRGVCFVLDISERKANEETVRTLNLSLEARVQERTLELARANEQLAAEVQERKRVAVALSAFSQLGQKLHSARTEKESARIIAETARSLIAYDWCSITLYGAESRLEPLMDVSFVDANAPMRSSLSVPIRNGSRVVGVLALKSCSADAFNIGDANTLQALGDYCGGALDRIHAEEARRDTERRFSAFMANAPALAWMKDADLRYVFTNPMFQEFTGCSAAEIEGRTDFELWPEALASRIRANDVQVFESQAPLETQESFGQSSEDDRTLLALRFLFTTSTGERFVAGMAIEITEQKRAEAALHRLPQSILEAQEKERRRVARELHDGVNQAIASIKFRIQTAEQQIHRGDPKWQDTCSKSKEMLDSVLQQVRRLSRNLRPGELDDFGLVPAARSACQEFEARTGIEVKFNHSGLDDRLPPPLELSLYRIIQEALTNIEKHAGATAVDISLSNDTSTVRLHISDNGHGFDAAEVQSRRSGLGLLHMRERASLVGGTFLLTSAPGAGVRLVIETPVSTDVTKEDQHEQPA